jgi:NAD(P)-dependent dehydrogenase (short-subunit alcohol dehydrogenase family)
VPSVLVTGAGRGIGRTTALRLAKAGWDVHAGVRRLEDGEALAKEAGAGRIVPVELDVVDAAQVAALPDAIGTRLDGLVNNAGTVVNGPVEGVPIDELRSQLEVNVVGQVAVTQAMLPLLREAKGRIVFIGSVSGRVATPFTGAYNASKFALEGLADALRMELRPWGIKVALVEPGPIDTDLWRLALESGEEAVERMTPQHRELYADQIASMRKAVPGIQRRAAPAEKVAAVIERALTSSRPRARYLVGADARGQVALRTALPTPVFDAAVTRVSNLSK